MSYLRIEMRDDGIAELILDQPGKSVNVMGEEYDIAMSQAVEQLAAEKENIRGVYVRSGKPSHFMAGGDVKAMLNMPLDPSPQEREELFAGMMRSKNVLRQLETLGLPVAVGISGSALGGGYELCLACHYRVAVDAPSIRIGLPESNLGLLPGAGGINRLTRLIGIQEALPLISQGRQLNPRRALEKGLVHKLVANEEEMHQEAIAWLLANPEARQPWDEEGYLMPGGKPGDDALQGFFFLGPVNMINQTGGNMPAQKAIFAAVYEIAKVDFDTAQKIESRYFLHLLLSPVARNMMTAFFIQMGEISKGASRPKGIEKHKVSRLGILGAGQMGSGIALLAAKSGMEAVLKDVARQQAEQGREYIRTACEKDRRISEEKAAEIIKRVQVADDMQGLAGCDAVIEAVFEDRQLKAEVTREVEAVLDKSALLASNTSGLPITGLAEAAARPENFIGMHFFSPAEKMPLVEIIRGRSTSEETLARAFDLARQLGKTPIVVNDAPGFFTTRVISKLVSQGLGMVTEGVHPAVVENGARQAGCPVGPLALVDEISLETSHRVAEQQAAAADTAAAGSSENQLVARMVQEFDRRGKVHGAGFYEYPKGGKKYIWPQLAELYANKAGRDMPFADVKDRLLFAEALEAVRALQEGVIESIPDGNIGSIMGIGFPAHTGGVFQFINSYGLPSFIQRCKELAARYGTDFEPPPLLLQKAQRGEIFA